MNPRVVEFIRTARERGVSDEAIMAELTKNGWTEQMISGYFSHKNIGFIQVTRETLALLISKFWPIFLVWLIPSLLTLVSIFGIGIFAFMMFGALMTRGNVWLYFGLAALFAVPLALSVPWGQASLIAVTSRKLNSGVKESLTRGARFLVKNSILSLIVGIAIVGNFLFLFVPGLIVMTFLVFASYSLVVGGLGVRASLAHSRSLSAGRFWRVFLILIVFILVNSGLSYLISKVTEWSQLPVWPSIGFQIFLNFLLASFGVVFLQVLYEDLSAGVALPAVEPKLPRYFYTGLIGFLLILFMPLLIGVFFGLSALR